MRELFDAREQMLLSVSLLFERTDSTRDDDPQNASAGQCPDHHPNPDFLRGAVRLVLESCRSRCDLPPRLYGFRGAGEKQTVISGIGSGLLHYATDKKRVAPMDMRVFSDSLG